MLQGWRAAALPLAGWCSCFSTATSRCRWYLVAVPGNDQVLAYLPFIFLWRLQEVHLPVAGQGGLISLLASPPPLLPGRCGGCREQQTPSWGRRPLERGPRRASRLLAQRGGPQPELLEVLAISSLIFLPLAFSVECFTSSLRQARGQRNSLCIMEGRLEWGNSAVMQEGGGCRREEDAGGRRTPPQLWAEAPSCSRCPAWPLTAPMPPIPVWQERRAGMVRLVQRHVSKSVSGIGGGAVLQPPCFLPLKVWKEMGLIHSAVSFV